MPICIFCLHIVITGIKFSITFLCSQIFGPWVLPTRKSIR